MLLTALVFLATFLPLTVCGGDIDPARFDELVLKDTRVWAVEFYSPMCGSCTEFAPTWATLESKFKSIESGKINIDSKEGLAVAQRLGVLDEGLPNIRLFDAQQSSSIMAGDAKPAKELMALLKKKIKGLSRRDDGYYLKAV
mmetsp:Transcript_7771/g.13084  ORF Transcript_7771/g.13084 Transcript_7771/m.13084 type:complete len:142 (-) Transcript_7771:155-580(-)|eukprot:CAMPEP_0114413924 /NCGR_PEP_ID=MMETSP0103-20121206/1115_1 /TAXON_ID=37642 ORGANISM="Paraphysomonas imperforata, Strain PA2" /NCGR_SAMPLE_ID=MMETSP0103 /ASSEMBLY_ACC=CAM_ASM_000201 /LENGTH=141 /DNA_ID=CAMNT_0001582033 /DNA_START=78 /DNA_END=503 /DNA_ORIENTATION=+